MHMKIYFSLAALLVVVIIGCSSTKTTETTAPSTAAASPASDHGKALYEANCTKCHALKDPKAFSEEKLRKMVPIMAAKAKIDAETQSQILTYVLAVNKQ